MTYHAKHVMLLHESDQRISNISFQAGITILAQVCGSSSGSDIGDVVISRLYVHLEVQR